MGSSPLKNVSSRDKVSYDKGKLKRMKICHKEVLSQALEVPQEELTSSSDKSCQDCLDLQEIINNMKAKCAVTSKQEQIRLLTLLPKGWSIERTMQEFDV